MKYICCVALFCFLHCSPQGAGPITTQVDYTDQNATVRVFVATRGSYQYLLALDQPGGEQLCMPDNLPAAFRTDGMQVKVSGKLLPDSVDIMRPSPNDVPEVDFRAPRFALDEIKPQ